MRELFKMETTNNCSTDTRFFEGFLTGLKFGFVHNLVYAPFFSKERSLQLKTSYISEYLKHSSKSLFCYSFVLSLTFGLRHYVVTNRDFFLFELTYNFKYLRNKKPFTDVMLYTLFAWPLGFTVNYVQSGRLIRGGLTWTLMIALIMRALDGGLQY